MTTVRRYPDLNADVLAVLTAAADTTLGSWLNVAEVRDALPSPQPSLDAVASHLKSLAHVGDIESRRPRHGFPRMWRLKASA